MLIIPAIDIKGGRCVRLSQGDFSQEKTYFENPVDMAIIWRKQNAKMLHIVDLDAALSGKPENLAIIEKIVNSVDIPIEVGGGIRNLETAKKYLSIGVCRIVIGSAAVHNPELVKNLISSYGPKKIVVGIDALNGYPKINGWLNSTKQSDIELGNSMKAIGVERVIYTDITKDGMLSGVGIDAIKKFVEGTGLKVTASGGVTSHLDLLQLSELKPFVDSVIIGKALYEETFPCQKLWHQCEKDLCIDKNFSTAPLKNGCTCDNFLETVLQTSTSSLS
ncbi:MAG: 1-(5-phosphoribosyl)-5-[(5-phosphoribosylamino)methylideneamino]imidazole-4-carboxamide isomerase [Chloroherpetonaceae bacterium]|nr:1-(5-phosphoribosyl)-5-[(5-phosphoribosylamino)methylideneamino]imidazole-4-carboxamide isomerase [Chloroherpetonaceae bacterium]